MRRPSVSEYIIVPNEDDYFSIAVAVVDDDGKYGIPDEEPSESEGASAREVDAAEDGQQFPQDEEGAVLESTHWTSV